MVHFYYLGLDNILDLIYFFVQCVFIVILLSGQHIYRRLHSTKRPSDKNPATGVHAVCL